MKTTSPASFSALQASMIARRFVPVPEINAPILMVFAIGDLSGGDTGTVSFQVRVDG